MVYTLTLNPAIDYIMGLDTLRSGETNRALRADVQFGGKGINVSWVLRELGVENTALGFVAGFTGEALTAHLKDRGIRSGLINLPEGMTRINVKLKIGSPAATVQETEINAAGPAIPERSLTALMDRLDGLGGGDTLVLAGSVPPSLPRDLYSLIMERLEGRAIRFVVDAEGVVLKAVLPRRPFLIKPNLAELEGLAGRSLPTEADRKAAALALQAAGARNVLVSLGGDGAFLLDEDGGYHASPAAAIRPVNTVGAGDSMVAGFLAGIERGYGYALMLGIAAGSATAASEGLATREEILKFLT